MFEDPSSTVAAFMWHVWDKMGGPGVSAGRYSGLSCQCMSNCRDPKKIQINEHNYKLGI